MFFSTSLVSNAQGPWAVSAHGGYSWMTGVVGADIQFSYFEISGGWMPTSMPMSGEKINNVSFAVTANTLQPGDNGYGFYLTLASASDGYRYEDSWGSAETYSMTILGGGMRYNNGPLWLKGGGGYGWCDQGKAWTWEVTLGLMLFKNL